MFWRHEGRARRARTSKQTVGIERIPLLASPQGGVAERLIKYREASADSEAGVVFRLRTQRKTTPAASSVASQHFFDDAATPPCCDARRGIIRATIPLRSHRRRSSTSATLLAPHI